VAAVTPCGARLIQLDQLSESILVYARTGRTFGGLPKSMAL